MKFRAAFNFRRLISFSCLKYEKTKFLTPGSHQGKGIAVFTSGGDSQGMNAAVRAVVRTGLYLGCKMYFIHEGYQGMVDGGHNITEAYWASVSSIMNKGGTIIGSARCKEFREREGRLKAAKNLVKAGISNLVVIGGDGSLTGANLFRQEWKSLLEELREKDEISEEEQSNNRHLNIVGLVGSIDNDFSGTDMTIGADSALHRIVDAIDSIVSTASSHQRTFIMEVMGRHCGYLSLISSLACEADFLFIPEWPPPLHWQKVLSDKLTKVREEGRRLNIIIVAEGAVNREGEPITSEMVKKVVVDNLKQDTRITVLGHVQRGGRPTAFDRILACRLGVHAVFTLLDATEDSEASVISLEGNRITHLPLMECVLKTQEIAKAMKEKNWDKAVQLRGRNFVKNLETFKKLTRTKPPEGAGDKKSWNVAVVHIGAPACGMNAAVRAFTKYSIYSGNKVYGIQEGVEGLIKGEFKPMEWSDVNGWVSEGGAMMGTKRTLPVDKFEAIAQRFKEFKIDGLLIIGGFEAFSAAIQLEKERKNYQEFCIPICVIPSTISNNVPGTNFSLGCDTALNEISEICDRIKQSAQGTKRRVFIIETMGGFCGYLATLAGLAGGADAAYIYEEKVTIKDLEQDLYHLASKMAEGVQRGIILRNECSSPNYNTDFLLRLYSEEGAGLFTTRMNVIGHMQQGGSPSPFDRNFGTKMGAIAAEWLKNKLDSAQTENGGHNTKESTVVMGMSGKEYTKTPLEDLIAKTDFKHRIPKEEWWLKLRPILRILAKHHVIYEEKGMELRLD